MEDKEKEFDFWNDHSLEFLEMAMKRDYQEKVASCDGYGKSIRPGCLDTIEFFLTGTEDKVDAISYDLQGCIYSHACANALIHLTKDKTPKEMAQISAEQIIAFLKTLPEDESHCAFHALDAFHQALKDLTSKD